MPIELACTLCHRRCAEPAGNYKDHAFCKACLVTLGRFACEASERVRIWKGLKPPGPAPEVVPLASTPNAAAQKLASSMNEALGLLGAFVGEVSAENLWGAALAAETHLDLAIAYREMGLNLDMALAAAEALRLSGLPAVRADVALELIRDSHFVN